MPLQKIGALLFSKKFRFFIKFSKICNFENFPSFSQKISKLMLKKLFWELVPFLTNSSKNLPHLAIVEKSGFFFQKKQSLSSKNKILSFWRALVSESRSTANQLQFGWKTSRTETRKNNIWCERNWQTPGRRRLSQKSLPSQQIRFPSAIVRHWTFGTSSWRRNPWGSQ